MKSLQSIVPKRIRQAKVFYFALILFGQVTYSSSVCFGQETPVGTLTTVNKVAPHAPELGAPDYEAQKMEWINNYPEEYEVFLRDGSKSAANCELGTPAASMAAPKLGPHAPDSGDPDFEAKKAEWIKNYPEEYNALHITTDNSNIECDEEEIPSEIQTENNGTGEGAEQKPLNVNTESEN